MLVSILFFLLGLSVSLNVFLFIKFRKTKLERPKSQDLREFLGDLARGKAVIKIEVLDPNGLFHHSMRGI